MKKKRSNTCLKCGKALPDDYKYEYCEACINEGIGNIKKYGKPLLAAALLGLLTKGIVTKR